MKKLIKILKSGLALLMAMGLIFLGALIIRKLNVVKDVQKINSDNFVISYKGILKSEAKGILKALEENYNRIRTELKDPKHEKILVYVHPNQKDFNVATGLVNSTAGGTSRGPLAFHLKYETWFNTLFPSNMNKLAIHEFTHCVQLNILIQDALTKFKDHDMDNFEKLFEQKFSTEYPKWLWEAICDYEANIVNSISVKYGMRNNPSLKSLNSGNQIYNVGYTITEYLVSEYGSKTLPDFIRSYGDFQEVLGVSENEFEKGWHQFVHNNY